MVPTDQQKMLQGTGEMTAAGASIETGVTEVILVVMITTVLIVVGEGMDFSIAGKGKGMVREAAQKGAPVGAHGGAKKNMGRIGTKWEETESDAL